MTASKTIVLFGIVSLSLFCFISVKNSNMGVRGALLLAGRGLFLLGLTSWLVSVLYPWLRPSSPSPRNNREVPDEEVKQKREMARMEQQKKHSEKATAYQDSVLGPRNESRLRQREERFYRMTGESWKLTQGHPLGEGESQEEEETEGRGNDTPNQQALRRRKLPESATRAPPQPERLVEKRVVVLPEEPPDNADGVVRVALRCPSGRTVKRKFLKSYNSLVLLDWLLKTGYHPTIYSICTSYPRCPLDLRRDLTLEDAGIKTDTILNVEEKDPSMT